MTELETNFMILVYGPIILGTFGLMGFIIARGVWRQIKANWKWYRRRHLKLVHSTTESVSTRRSSNIRSVS